MRYTSKVAGLAVALVASAAAANAQVTVTGTTYGCFGAGCNPVGSTSASYTVAGTGEQINFTNSTFSGTTNPVTNGFSVGNFGSFILVPPPSGTTPNTTFSTPFTLLFVINAPAGSTSPTTTFLVSGFVGSTNGQGTRDISYGGGTTAFTFTNGSGTITVNPDAIGVQANNIGGRVTANVNAVPEPSTYALMGTGLAGLLAAARRRRSA